MTLWLETFVELALGLALCWAGKRAYGFFHRGVALDDELVVRDNPAFAVPLAGYYLAILICLGAAFSGPERGGMAKDAALTLGWGLAAIVLLNVSALVSERKLFEGLNLRAETLERRNLAAGALAAGSYVASGLVTLGALGGPARLLPALALWAYGLVWLVMSVQALPRLLRYELSPEIARGNLAAALASSGALVAVGNVLRMALASAPSDVSGAVAAVTGYALLGVALVLLAGELIGRILIKGFTLRHELVEQKEPNAGLGFLVAMFFVGASVLVGWVL